MDDDPLPGSLVGQRTGVVEASEHCHCPRFSLEVDVGLLALTTLVPSVS